MGDCPQEICPDPFFLGLVKLVLTLGDHLILPGEFRGHGADRDRDDQHTDEGDGISAQGKVDLKERKGEESVDKDHAEQGRDYTVQVSGRPSCNQDEGKDIDQRNVGGTVLYKMKQKECKPGGKGQHQECIGDISKETLHGQTGSF